MLAKIPRETTKTKDISETDGLVKHGGIVKGQRKIIIVPGGRGAEPREHAVPRGVHVNVQEGEPVRAGEPLVDGPSNPHDIRNVLGEKGRIARWHGVRLPPWSGGYLTIAEGMFGLRGLTTTV